MRNPVVHEGDWQLLEVREHPLPNGNQKSGVAYFWQHGPERRLVVANLSLHSVQWNLSLDWPDIVSSEWQLRDLLNGYELICPGDELVKPGLSLALPGGGCHLFAISPYAAETSHP